MLRLTELVSNHDHRKIPAQKGNPTVCVNLPRELDHRLRTACEQSAIPISRVIRAALEKFLSEAEAAEAK